MINIHAGTRYFLYQGFTDMRMSFNGLCGLVTNKMHMDIMSGDVFIFFNKRKTHLKLLGWDGDGFAIYYKRLEEGTYELPKATGDLQNSLYISHSQLLLILQGISLKQIQYRKRYHQPSVPATTATG